MNSRVFLDGNWSESAAAKIRSKPGRKTDRARRPKVSGSVPPSSPPPVCERACSARRTVHCVREAIILCESARER